MEAKIDLFILTARRLFLFEETIRTFVEMNKESLHTLNKIWILDDRSSWEDRKKMSDICFELFGDKVYLVAFDSHRNFGWIDKFNFIGRAAEAKYTFLLEDDWKCLESLGLESHLELMESSQDLTQIAFCDPLFVQEEEIQKIYQGKKYWKNPWPNEFRHISAKVEAGWRWTYVRMNHYTNNPAITRTSVFKIQSFVYNSSFEHLFADQQRNPLQYFTTDLFFEHIGSEDALEKRR